MLTGKIDLARRKMSVRSLEPEILDLETPQGSIFGDVADNETQYNYQRGESSFAILKQHHTYYSEMLQFLDDMGRNGPISVKAPKPPKLKLSVVLGTRKQKSTPVIGTELHNFLLQNICSDYSSTCPNLSQVTITGFTQMIPYLKSGYAVVKRQNAVTLGTYIEYGDWLNIAFEYFQLGDNELTWKEWLLKNIGLSDSFARHLRYISRIFHGYPRFKKLALPFSKVYSLRNQIRTMLATDEGIASYWRNFN